VRRRLTLIEKEMSIAESVACAFSRNPPEKIVGDRNLKEDRGAYRYVDWAFIAVIVIIWFLVAGDTTSGGFQAHVESSRSRQFNAPVFREDSLNLCGHFI
tara:strand:+ start:207 stop:506 length:300 start_codon:yes stop_codon:yes gene_type:complete